ncbi:MAG TPA: hypothetical protein VIR30_01305, partial [Nocardioides sp.]
MPAPILGEPNRLADRLVAALLETERQRLDTAVLPDRPVAYCLGLDIDSRTLAADGRNELEMYGTDLLTGTRAIYVGQAASGRERAGRHRINVAQSKNLHPEDLWICAIEQPTVGASRYAEELLQGRLLAPWCDPRLAGFGSKAQGGIRQAGQRPSPWDACGHRRRWAPRATIAEEVTAILGAAVVLTRPDPGCAL